MPHILLSMIDRGKQQFFRVNVAMSVFEVGGAVMLRHYLEAVKRLSTDQDGVVSLEYVIVAGCVVTAVIAAFTGSLPGALNTGFAAVTAAMGGL